MRSRIVAVVLCLATGLVAVTASAQGNSKGHKVRVAAGTFAGRSWFVSLYGRGGRRCYALRLNGRQVSGGTGTCRADARVDSTWKPLFGVSDDSATVMLALTSPRVRSLRLLTRHPQTTRPDNWIRVRSRRITRGQARRAHVKRNFRFVVLHSRGTLCVPEVVAFNGRGERIDKLSGPCEF
jgi:hypothetical protein